jgi:hypothetical protein
MSSAGADRMLAKGMLPVWCVVNRYLPLLFLVLSGWVSTISTRLRAQFGA